MFEVWNRHARLIVWSMSLALMVSCSDSNTAPLCDDQNPCTDDAFDPVLGCQHLPHTRTCDDGDPLTTADQCAEGVCVGGPPPFAQDDFVVKEEGTPITIDVRANDPGFKEATVDITEPPRHGSVTLTPDGHIRYQTDPGFNGGDQWRYSVTSGDTITAEARVYVTTYTETEEGAPFVTLPRTALTRRELAVLVNADDPDSIAIADYYVAARQIPEEHVITLSLGVDAHLEATLSPEAFAPIHAQVEAELGPAVQALALAWTSPYRVGGMSITSAFALGHHPQYESKPCALTEPVPTFNVESTQLYTDYGIRPAMMLAGNSTEDVFALIDRGLAADHTFPTGTGYQIRTSDAARNVRWPAMLAAQATWNHAPDGLAITYLDNSLGQSANTISFTPDVLFYFTGLTQVPEIESNTYLPGAIADHLTSFGGQLTKENGQMSILAWISAGATASYGTVVEPCNFVEKFPDPRPIYSHYYRGQTLLESYWKSVAQPGEGVFIGEPLARPWGKTTLTYHEGTLTILTTMLKPGVSYRIESARWEENGLGPFETQIEDISVSHHQAHEITVEVGDADAIRLTRHESEERRPTDAD